MDVDEKIEQGTGRSIPQILTQDGELAFRNLEANMLKRLGKQSGLIIATGGGCVLRPENYDALRQNGIVIWLKRSLASLPTDGRPLSNKTTAEEMYKEREPLYAGFSDLSVHNDQSPEQTVQSIIEKLQQGDSYENFGDQRT
jgi:shikimate dehydrogenase